MKNLLKHFIQKLFATKISTPCRTSLKDVDDDVGYFKKQYADIGMKLIDISYKEHIAKSHHRDEKGYVWLHKSYMSYAVLYFVKEDKGEK